MKNNKVLIIIMVVFLNVISCVMVAQSLIFGNSEYNDALENARQLSEAKLCAQSVEAYNEVLIIKDTFEVRKELIDTYAKGLDNGEFSNEYEVLNVVMEMVDIYPNDARMYDIICKMLIKYEQYEDCVTLLKKAQKMKITSKELDKTLETIRYAYEREFSMYTNVYPEFDNAYLVDDDGSWKFLDADGSSGVAKSLLYATPFSEGYALVRSNSPEDKTETYLINKENIRQVYFDNRIENSTGVGKGKDNSGNDLLLIACQINGKYQYYNIKGEPLFGEYLFAGRIRNNVAAVQIAENQWKFINGNGDFISDKVFKDVILNEFSDCAPKGLIIASEDGKKYHLYDMELKRIGSFACDGAKAFVDDCAAFKSGEKWGFVDAKGNIVIKPQYDDAKSFSNGVAAVCQNETWKFVDKSNKVAIDGEFEDAGYLSKAGFCFVKEKGYWTGLQMFYVEG